MVWAGVAVAGAMAVKAVVGAATKPKEVNKNTRGGADADRNGGRAMEATNQLLDPASNLGGFLE